MTHTENPTRVSDYENMEVKGHALCGDEILEGHLEEVRELRAREAAYWATLPDDPETATDEIRDLIAKLADTNGLLYRIGANLLAIEALIKDIIPGEYHHGSAIQMLALASWSETQESLDHLGRAERIFRKLNESGSKQSQKKADLG